MARETDYTVVYRAAADFSALAREAAKAKAILKAMREEEEKANKVSLRDQDALEKARTRARKALEAQNMAATTSARISREMAERGKKEADTVKELARSSETAARQINKLAEAYKKLNSASSGDTASDTNRNITGRTSFAEVTAKELEKVQKNLASYIGSARQATDTNTRLSSSTKDIKQSTSEYSDILTRLSNAQKDAAKGTTIVTQETKKLGDVIETTTRRVTNAGTEAEKVTTTVRRVTKETNSAARGFAGWAENLAGNMRRVWKEAESGTSVIGKLRRSLSDSRSDQGWADRAISTLKAVQHQASRVVATFAYLPRVLQLAIGIAVIFEPAVAVLSSLGAAALGAANNLVYLAGSLAAIPGLIAAGATAMGALFVAVQPVIGVFKQYSKALLETETNASKAAPKQKDNADAIRNAARGVRSAMESLADAQRSEKRAQDDLSQAWRDAKKDLKDLRDEVARGSLDEEAAQIRLLRAKEEQVKVNRDLKSTTLDRREAALGVKEAEADLSDVRKKNKENQQELSEAEKKGVAGSEKVIRAQENLANAHRGVKNASLNLADAKVRLAEASKVEVTQATLAHTQQDRYRKMLDQLGPKTRQFVGYIIELRDEWKKVQRATSEAFFKNIAGDTKEMNSLLPITSNLLTKAADALGKVAHRGLEMLASGPWKRDFKQLAKDNAVLIDNMGSAGLSVADAFRHITMAAAPFTKWVTAAIKEGAGNFAAWAKKAREDHSIQRFLDETKDRLQQMWRIAKNVFSTLVSFNTATNDFGKWMLDRLEAMTKRWKDASRAQEENGSGLKKYLTDVRPVLTAVGSLVGALATGLANIAADPENLAGTVTLLTTLEKEVLPPLLRFLNELNDSGIAVTVAHALGTIFTAFSNFLENGGGGAISKFVDTFAWFVDLAAQIANMPGVGLAIAGIASAWAYMAGVTLAAKFVGVFKLIDAFKWIIATSGAVISKLKGVGDAAAEAGAKTGAVTTTTVTGGGTGGGSRPSGDLTGPIGTATSFSVVSNDELSKVKKNLSDFGPAAEKATTKTGYFKRSLDGLKASAGGVKSGLSNVVDFMGGPWGAAIAAVTAAITFATIQYQKHQDRVQQTKDAYKQLADAYDPLKEGNQEQIKALIEQNSRFGDVIESLNYYGISTVQVSSALKGNTQDLDAVNKAMEARQAQLKKDFMAGKISQAEYGLLSGGLRDMQNEINGAATKQKEWNKLVSDSAHVSRTWKDRLGGLSQSQVENAQGLVVVNERINALNGFLDTMANAASTATDRANALKAATDAIYGAQMSANESAESFNRSLLSFSEIAKRNHGDLRLTTKGGLETRDALEEAAKATRDETISLIASGTPYQEAIKKHDERIKALKEEARKAGLNKEETAKLIAMYGEVPGNVQTNIAMSGYEKAYEELRNLKIAQLALEQGIPVDQAAKEFNKQRQKAPSKGNFAGAGGLATGGPVWGEGTKTSDSIPAWLSNGEFVQKAAAVDYYGHNLMHAMNNMTVKREALEAAISLSRGVNPASGDASKLDPMYALGGAVLRLANGGFAQPKYIDQVDKIRQPGAHWPFPIGGAADMIAMSKKMFEEWKKNFVANQSGGSVGAGGLRSGILHVLNDLREHFGKVPLISGFRKGSRTLSGNTSYHASGRAIDIAPVRAWAEYLQATFGPQLKELITPWRDLNMWNGRPHKYSRAIEAQHGVFGQNAHIHAAYAQGGLVDALENMMSFSGMASPAMAGVPSSNLSGLSQAARAVTNTTNSGLTIGDITINNPMQERGGDSIRKSILRSAFLFDGP